MTLLGLAATGGFVPVILIPIATMVLSTLELCGIPLFDQSEDYERLRHLEPSWGMSVEQVMFMNNLICLVISILATILIAISYFLA